MPNRSTPAPRWMTACLLAAGAYNILWGIFAVLYPDLPFRWADLPLPNYPSHWQFIGMIVGVFGVGYIIAAFDPARHWLMVLVGLLSKLLGPLSFVHAASIGELPWRSGWILLTNDLIWWVPLALILRHAYRSRSTSPAQPASD